jgi:hypothetical protein
LLPFGITTVVFSFPVSPVPDHPLNVYPSFVGLFNVISSLSTVYDVGFAVATTPPFKSYEISYSTGVQCATNVLSPVSFSIFSTFVLFSYHPANV